MVFQNTSRAHYSKFATGYQIRNYLVEGTLETEVTIQIRTPVSPLWKPAKTLVRHMLGMSFSKDYADVIFAVGGEQFPCHRCVLARRAPGLVALSEDVPNGTTIPIEGLDPELFPAFLHFLYSDGLPDMVVFKEKAKALLEIADKFECTPLKLLAESEMVESGITVEKVAELLLFADRLNCALLREAAIKFIVSNRHEVIKTSGYSKLGESLTIMKELLMQVKNNTVLFGFTWRPNAESSRSGIWTWMEPVRCWWRG